jgi:hypothetical protein
MASGRKEEENKRMVGGLMKRKPKTFVLRESIYGVAIQVSIGDKSIIKDGYSGQVMTDDAGAYWIRVSENPKEPEFHNTLAHEVMHAVFAILERAGIKYSKDSEEAYCHLNGFITGEIYKRL